jgi:sodium/potassium-transporting ATPase subunit alpha
MHVEDTAIYDVPFTVPSLRERLESAPPAVVENLRQLPVVSAICNAAAFEGSASESNRNIIGDATGKWSHDRSEYLAHILINQTQQY